MKRQNGMREKGSIVQTIGIILAIVGLGSTIADDGTNIDLMQWSTGHQPYAGLAVGAATSSWWCWGA